MIIRLVGGLLACAAFLPWYRSIAGADHDTYLGNPLPLVDWLLIFVALTVVVWPRFALTAAIFGLISVALTLLLMYWDRAEGLTVQILPGLPIAAGLSAGLLIAYRRHSIARRDDPAGNPDPPESAR